MEVWTKDRAMEGVRRQSQRWMDWREREKGREVREAKGERERENKDVCLGLGKKKMAFP